MKSYTDLDQSKKLAEILPLESADMCFNISQRINMPPLMTPYCKFKEFFNMGETPDFLIPCWSLAALLEIIGNIRTVNERMVTIEVGKYAGNKWYVELVFVMTESKALMTYTKELIDACVEMIYKLKENNLL